MFHHNYTGKQLVLQEGKRDDCCAPVPVPRTGMILMPWLVCGASDVQSYQQAAGIKNL